jgi:hypothetical protein
VSYTRWSRAGPLRVPNGRPGPVELFTENSRQNEGCLEKPLDCRWVSATDASSRSDPLPLISHQLARHSISRGRGEVFDRCHQPEDY